MNAHKGNTVLPKTQSLPFSPSLSLSLFLLYLLSLVPLLSHPASSFALPFHILCAHASLIASIKNHSILTPSKRKKSKAQHLALLFSPPRMPDITIPQEDNPKPSSLLSSIPTAAAPTSTSPLSTTLRTASNQIPFPPLSPFNDPFTTNIIHDTDDSNLVKTMALVANAGRNAGVAANANAVASARSSASVHSNHNPSPLSSSSSSLASSTKLTTVLPSSEAIAGSRRPTQLGRASVSRPLIEVPQPQSPISLHHALDGTIPVTPVSNPSTTARILPRSIDTHVQDTLAKDSTRQHNASSTSSYGSNSSSASSGPRRIMTPTSRLAETAVGVREVSKKIGRARVKWEMPKTVMIVTKPGDESLLKITREIAFWMIASRGLTVYVEDKMKDIPKFRYPSFLKSTKLGYDYTPSLKFWTAELCAQEAHLFDFAITLGGDGTVLFTSWLFQQIVPPILPFSAGSLGFLTPFPTTDYQKILSGCLDTGVRVNLRMRFSCTIYRCLEQRTVETTKKKKNRRQRNKNRSHGQNVPQDDSDEDSDSRRRQMPTVLTTPTETFEILNDLVLDRGPSANLSLLELFGDEQHLTTVQADGIVISTPTGSTAYSLAAGGPLSHPEIPAILISPICPHTLSFRPMLLPDSMELRICVPFDSRSTAWASFDGRGRVELKQGDHIKVTASVYPFPTICSNSQSSDWFHSLSRCLRWNERERQKGFTVVEHSSAKRTKKSNSSSNDGAQSSSPTRSHGTQGHQRSRSNADNSLGSSASTSGHIHEHSHSHSHSHSSGSNSGGSSKARQSSPRPGVVSPVERKGSRNSQDYFYESPHDTDTMLTCWGTDSSDSDGDDDEDSDAADDKDEAADGDGEWEAGSSSDDDDDDDNEVKETALGKPSNNEAPSAYGNGSSGEGVAAPKGTIPNLLGSPLGAVEILTNKLNHALLEPELET